MNALNDFITRINNQPQQARKPIVLSVGKRIKQVRSSHNMTIEQFSRYVKTPARILALVESGYKVPSEYYIARIARRCSLSTEWLVYGNQKETELDLRKRERQEYLERNRPFCQLSAYSEDMLNSMFKGWGDSDERGNNERPGTV